MSGKQNLKAVSDGRLLRGLFEVLKQTRHDEADLVAHIAEVDARKLYARQAAPSMFVWCTETLHLSEHEAYLRITVARASREHPVLLELLRDGRLHLSGIGKLVPHLTAENRDVVLKRATGMTYRQVKELVSELEPKPDAPARIRKLPDRSGPTPATESPLLRAPSVESPTKGPRTPEAASPGSVGTPARPDETGVALGAHRVRGAQEHSLAGGASAQRPGSPRRGSVEPLAPARFKVEFTAGTELRDKLERLQALMRSSVPDGDLGTIIEQAITEKLERLEARRFAKTKKPRKQLGETDTKPKSRYVPAAVRRVVEKRDGGRCTYRGEHGKRCSKRHDLEFHHRKPFARGGEHSPEVVCLMCRTHNALLAEQDFGKETMARHRRRASRGGGVAEVEVVRAGPGQSGLRAP